MLTSYILFTSKDCLLLFFFFLPFVPFSSWSSHFANPAAADKTAGLRRLNWNRIPRGGFHARPPPHRRLLNHSVYDQNICRTNGPPTNGPERRCKAADQLQHDDSRNARHLLFTLHWLRIRIPFKGSCFHLQEALCTVSHAHVCRHCVAATLLLWNTLRAMKTAGCRANRLVKLHKQLCRVRKDTVMMEVPHMESTH